MTEFIDRKITQAIENAAASFPVITITGPRQSGKTTLARHMFPEYPYFSLENPDVRNLAMEDPVGFLNNTTEGIILDEVQNSPQLMSYIQGIVDNDYEKRFILTGSNNFSMLKNVSQSLAGRSAVFELLPFSINEPQQLRDRHRLSYIQWRLSGHMVRRQGHLHILFKLRHNLP